MGLDLDHGDFGRDLGERLKCKERHSKLGASTQRVGDGLRSLKNALVAANLRLRERVEILVTIVTRHTWDWLHDLTKSGAAATSVPLGRMGTSPLPPKLPQ